MGCGFSKNNLAKLASRSRNERCVRPSRSETHAVASPSNTPDGNTYTIDHTATAFQWFPARERDQIRGRRERQNLRRRASRVDQPDPAEGDEEERRVPKSVSRRVEVVRADQRERGREQQQRRRPRPPMPRQHPDDPAGEERDAGDREERTPVGVRRRGHERHRDRDETPAQHVQDCRQSPAKPSIRPDLHENSSDGARRDLTDQRPGQDRIGENPDPLGVLAG